jgi:(R,R)-butanediol dehydrogenase / meso-butanediol dehydrogenase / diacetyl reductase
VRAAFFGDRRELNVREVEQVPCGPSEVRLDVHACGVCASNIHQWNDPAHITPRLRAIPGALGHEVSGLVTEVGNAVTTHSVGDQVVVEPSAATACGSCDDCATGAYWFCRQPKGTQSFGFSETMLVPAFAAFVTPTAMPHHVAALTEPISCGVHGVRHSWTARRAGTIEGLRVVVLGAGMLGIGAVAAARHLGAADVVSVARHPHQRRAADAVGATEVLDPSASDIEHRLRRLRPHLVIEAVGSADTLALASNVVSTRGEVVVLGHIEEPTAINCARSLSRENRYFFAVSYASRDGVYDFDVALQLMTPLEPALRQLPFVEYGLTDIGAAFDDVGNKRTQVNRVMIVPDRAA